MTNARSLEIDLKREQPRYSKNSITTAKERMKDYASEYTRMILGGNKII